MSLNKLLLKYFCQRGVIIQDGQLSEGQILFEEIQYVLFTWCERIFNAQESRLIIHIIHTKHNLNDKEPRHKCYAKSGLNLLQYLK